MMSLINIDIVTIIMIAEGNNEENDITARKANELIEFMNKNQLYTLIQIL